MTIQHYCINCVHWRPFADAASIGECCYPLALPTVWPAAYLNYDGTRPTLIKFVMSNLAGGACQTFEAKP